MKLNKENISYICEAMIEAKKSDVRCKHGCVIVKNGKIIAKGHNRHRGYDKYGKALVNQSATIHAEADAINSCGNKNKLCNADLYVVRIDVRHEKPVLNSKPCHNCSQLIISCMENYGLRNAYYSTTIVEPFI